MKRYTFCVKLIAFIVCVILSISGAVCAFSDVDSSSTEGIAIVAMQEKAYIQGFEDGTFRPGATLTRAEFVTIINKMYMFYVESENIFTDISKNDWFYHDVLTAVQAGYIKGMGDGRFAPNEPVTREQVCVMLNSLLGIESIYTKPQINDRVSDWAKDSVEKVVGIYLFTLEPGGKFRATEPITRGEVCVALEKCILDIDFEERFESFDFDKLAEDELRIRLQRIIDCMENVIMPTYKDEKVIVVANMVVNSMKEYLKDPTFDYVNAAKETYEVYRTFNRAKADEFKKPIYRNIEVEDMAILFEFFYTPELDFIN